jgi:hypothetical protein
VQISLHGHTIYVCVCVCVHVCMRATDSESSRAIAQAVSRRLPIAAARLPPHITSCGICGGQSGIGKDFPRVLRFPLPILIPPTAPHSSIIRGQYSRPISGRRTKWTQFHPTPKRERKRENVYVCVCVCVCVQIIRSTHLVSVRRVNII